MEGMKRCGSGQLHTTPPATRASSPLRRRGSGPLRRGDVRTGVIALPLPLPPAPSDELCPLLPSKPLESPVDRSVRERLEKQVKPTPRIPNFEPKDWAAAFTSQHYEYDYTIREIEGTIPTTIRGTLFRNGPGNTQRGDQRYNHFLDGDGYVCMFTFASDGKVHFKSRFVKTKEYLEEEAANKVLYRNTFGTQRAGGPLSNLFDMKLKNPANTNLLAWGNRLLALWEAGAPYELHPYTLETKPHPATLDGFITSGLAPSTTGNPTLDKVLNFGNAMTAHPHVEPARAGYKTRMVLWKWAIRNTLKGSILDITVGEFDSHWNRINETKVAMKDCAFCPHDFSITPNHFVFFQSPTSFDMLPYMLGQKGPAQCVNISSKPLRVHVFPRDKSEPMVIDTEPSFIIHQANAFERGDEIEVWSSGWGPEGLASLAQESGMFGSWKELLTGDLGNMPHSSLWRHRINTKTREVKRELLYGEQSSEHPQVNPRFFSHPTRYVYFSTSHHPRGRRTTMPPQTFTRLDTHTGEIQSWYAGPRAFCEELVFVPGPQADEVEDDGHLCGLVYDAESNRTSLVILDAADFTKGPVARLWLTHHIPHGLHGCYSPRYYGP